MSKTLIVYGTRHGATAKSSEVIARILKEKYYHKVEIVNLDDYSNKLDLTGFENVIIGSSIVGFQWTKSAKGFLKNDFTGKKLFVFISSAGFTYPALLKGKMGAYKRWKWIFLHRVVKKHTNIKPTSTAVFGGWRVPNTVSNWREEDVVKWAEEIGNLLI